MNRRRFLLSSIAAAVAATIPVKLPVALPTYYVTVTGRWSGEKSNLQNIPKQYLIEAHRQEIEFAILYGDFHG